MRWWTVVCLLAMVLAADAAAEANDWPQYRGPNRDSVVPARPCPEHWPEKLTVRWEVPLGDGFSSPAVAEGNVFVLSGADQREVVRCLDVRTGQTRWQFDYHARFRSSYGDGPRATPAVDGNRVYTVGGTGEMHCLNVADGQTIWHKSFRQAFAFRVPTYGLSASPLVDGEVVFVHTGAGSGNSVVALNKLTGDVLWHALDDPAGYASPMLVPESAATGPKQLIVLTEHAVVSLDPDNGKLFWRYPWTTSYEQNIATPVLQGDLLLVTSLSGTAVLRLGSKDRGPTFKEVWRQQQLISHFSCPVAADGVLYLPYGRRPDLRGIEMASGRELWRHDLPARNRCGLVLAGEMLFVYTDRGLLLVLRVSRTGCEELAQYAVAERNWVPPVLAGACLFLRDHRSLKCVPLPGAVRQQPAGGMDP